MGMSVSMRASYEAMQEFEKKLSAYDFGAHSVYVLHEEGTTYFIRNAFIVDTDGDYIWVFCEHQVNLIFHKDELSGYSMLRQSSCFTQEYQPKNYRGETSPAFELSQKLADEYGLTRRCSINIEGAINNILIASQNCSIDHVEDILSDVIENVEFLEDMEEE